MKTKRYVLVAFLLILLSFSFACSNMGNSIVIEMPGVDEVGSSEAADRDYDVTLISSYDEYNEFLTQERIANANSDFLSKLSEYGSVNYYMDFYLVVILIEFTTTGPEPSISRAVDTNGVLSITLSIKDNGTSGLRITPWAILLKYPKTNEIIDVKMVFC